MPFLSASALPRGLARNQNPDPLPADAAPGRTLDDERRGLELEDPIFRPPSVNPVVDHNLIFGLLDLDELAELEGVWRF
jgi:hypothetical protein